MTPHEQQIYELHSTLAQELASREAYRSIQPLTMLGYLPQVPIFTAILDNYIMDHSQSVVLTIEVNGDACLFRLCCPVQLEAYQKLAALDYAPPLRSRWHLTVGLGAEFYAYAVLRLNLLQQRYGSV